jgi:hypothetical protein
MKKFTHCLITIVLFFALTACLQAQVTVVGHITAEVVSALTATETSPLSFGQFSPETAGGQIILTPQGIRSSTGTVNIIGGMHNQGSFFVTGEPEALISIQLPSGSTTLTNSANSGTMTVTSWVSDPSPQSNVTIPSSGAQSVNIGATLIVGTILNNPVGLYAGTYNITFNYN